MTKKAKKIELTKNEQEALYQLVSKATEVVPSEDIKNAHNIDINKLMEKIKP